MLGALRGLTPADALRLAFARGTAVAYAPGASLLLRVEERFVGRSGSVAHVSPGGFGHAAVILEPHALFPPGERDDAGGAATVFGDDD